MMDKLIQWSVTNRYLVIALSLVGTVFGLYLCFHTPVDVFPDLTAPTVVVLTEAPGYSPSEVENLVTFPLETTLNGAPGIRRVRSASMPGYSIVWSEFDWGEEMNVARQIVAERVQLTAPDLPEDIMPPILAPPTSLMGEIQIAALHAENRSMTDLQNYAEIVLARRLLAVPGVAQITVVGSGDRQYQVALKPDRLAALGITLAEVAEVLAENNMNIPAGFISERGTEYLVTGLGRLQTVEDIGKVVVTTRQGVPVFVSDVAEVRLGAAPTRGTGSANGKPAVLLIIQKQPQANTLELDKVLEEVFAEEEAKLPTGMEMNTSLMKQADFIRIAVSNVANAIRDGMIIVVLIMAFFLLSGKALFITLTALPISLIIAVLSIQFFGGSINTMTLGGLAIAIGSLMDDAVIDVENTIRRLRLSQDEIVGNKPRALRIVYEASSEVRSAIVFATVIITVVFVPLYTLENVEGRLLRPLATSYIVAIFASLLVALTLTPALEAVLLPGSRIVSNPREPRVASLVRRGYNLILRPVLRHPWLVSLPVAAVFIASLVGFSFMGQSFLPDFNEGALNVVANTLPGTSLEESNRIGLQVERLLMEVPEITSVARKTGRGELDEHAQGIEGSEMEATYLLTDRSKDEMLVEVREKLDKVPGISYGIGGPISHRIDHMLSGARSSVAIKFTGEDLYVLRELAEEAQERIRQIPGAADIAMEPQTDVPEVSVRFDRDLLARQGISFEEAGVTLRAALFGAPVTRIYEGRNAYDLVLRLAEDKDATLTSLEKLPLRNSAGALVPLHTVATVFRGSGPNVITRDQVQRKIFVTCNPSGRDVASLVRDIRTEIDPLLAGKEGYSVHYGGQFESAAAASGRLLASGAVVLFGVFALLLMAFKNIRDALFVMASLPLALIGGVVAVFLMGGVLSVASIIGFISVFGVAARNGIMLVQHIRHLQLEEGVTDFAEAVRRGAVERIVPVLMTALSTGFALIPLVLAHEAPGNEIQSPMAVVIIGGLLTATFLNMIVVPTLYLRLGRPALMNENIT
ncbi:MAG: efflux RND transporter permease subunit [Candidatus Hydrogenedens sp.]|jgi:CzcA family heavy metal efflux pump|nr:efflux RND transporter permease subunit [Candidatus Hydrogenedens sp.]